MTTGAVSRAKLQSNHRHQQSNTQLSTAGCPCRPTNSVKELKDNSKKYTQEKQNSIMVLDDLWVLFNWSILPEITPD